MPRACLPKPHRMQPWHAGRGMSSGGHACHTSGTACGYNICGGEGVGGLWPAYAQPHVPLRLVFLKRQLLPSVYESYGGGRPCM